MTRFQIKIVAALWVIAIVSSFFVVSVSYEGRLLADELLTLQMQEEELSVRWGRLLLEEGSLGAYVFIDQRATHELGMVPPSPASIRVVTP